jgi:hypothetical protein
MTVTTLARARTFEEEIVRLHLQLKVDPATRQVTVDGQTFGHEDEPGAFLRAQTWALNKMIAEAGRKPTPSETTGMKVLAMMAEYMR